MVKKAEEAIPTTIYNTEKQDEELPQNYDPSVVNDGFKPSFLYVERGPGAGQLVQIRQGAQVIGRASVSDLRLQHSSISRRHAQLTRSGEQFYLRDFGSQNGTFVNKIRIATEIEIYPGDQISVGNAVVKLRGPLQQAQAPANAKGQLKVKPAPAPKTAAPARQKAPTANVMKIALFAGAAGFGLAGVLMFAWLSVPSTGPSFQALQPTTKATASPSDRRASRAPALSEAEKARLVEQRMKEAMETQKAAAVEAAPAVEPAPVAEAPRAVAVSVNRAHHPAQVRVASAAKVEPVEPEAAAPTRALTSSAKRSSLLTAYEKGDATASLEAARRAGDSELAGKLTKFLAEYNAGGAAIASKNGTAAIKHFDAALKLDEQISSGWSKYGTEIRRQLSGLWTLVGLTHVENGNTDAAKLAFQAAMKHDPENSRAKAQLEELNAGDKPEKQAPQKTIDDAFGDEQAPAAKTPPRKVVKPAAKAADTEETSKASAIDQAFGD